MRAHRHPRSPLALELRVQLARRDHRATSSPARPAAVTRTTTSPAAVGRVHLRRVPDGRIRIERADGSRVTVVVNIRPMRNQVGQITAAINCFYDITERKRAEEQRAKSDELRERMLGIVGHDLRTPLSVISSGVGLLQRGALGNQDLKTVDRIGRSAKRMANMISQLLDFTHARLGGGIPIERARVGLSDVCTDVIAEFEVARPDRVLRFHSNGDTDGMWDGSRLAQVVTNLIGNAIEHGAAERAIDVRTSAEGGEVQLSVHSEGPPIPVELLSVIFEAFRRGRLDGRSRAAGLGLGLFISREIVRAHGGALEVSSTETAGTTFTARLPRDPSVILSSENRLR